jgi:hypothetical protein
MCRPWRGHPLPGADDLQVMLYRDHPEPVLDSCPWGADGGHHRDVCSPRFDMNDSACTDVDDVVTFNLRSGNRETSLGVPACLTGSRIW